VREKGEEQLRAARPGRGRRRDGAESTAALRERRRGSKGRV